MSRLVIIGTGITLIVLVIQMSALFGAKATYGEEIGNPLAPYTEIMPGQPMEVFSSRWCANYEEIPQEGVRICSIQPEQGSFVSVIIYIRDHIVQRVMFRATGLSIGDLPLAWGRPTMHEEGGTHYARWEHGDYIISVPTGDDGRLSYWLSVSFLSVEVKQQQDESEE